MTEETGMTEEMSYEEKVAELESLLRRLDDGSIPMDQLSADVKRGADLIKEVEGKLREVEAEVRDAFKELEVSEEAL
ncbi:MAG: exodeoxyribonuclease VII small subunit [Deltaproteobacteria bacterium]|nr:exodeoxyribonuclease VII small subunit [Deltaproteobacteria bacterium]